MPKILIFILPALLLIIFVVVTMFPGVYPIRAFEPVFTSVCHSVMHGEINKIEKTMFVGRAGMLLRRDFIECGVDRASDAEDVCFINETASSIGENPLGAEYSDECYTCVYGAEEIRYNGELLGKSCKPYRKLWRWKYVSEF